MRSSRHSKGEWVVKQVERGVYRPETYDVDRAFRYETIEAALEVCEFREHPRRYEDEKKGWVSR